MKKFTVACLAFAAVTAVAFTASAEDLGGEGQIAISSDLQLELSSTSYKAPEGEDPDSTTHILIAPALDYFVAESISVGGRVGYESVSVEAGKLSNITLAPRVGYAIPVGDGMAFWPKIGIAYNMQTSSPDEGESTSGNTMALEIYAPLAIQPVENFFIGIGPELSMDLSSKWEDEDSTKTTTMGLLSTVGGYF